MRLTQTQRAEYDKLLDLTTDTRDVKLSGTNRSIFTELTTGVDGVQELISRASFKCRVDEIKMYTLSTGVFVTMYINDVPVVGATDVAGNGGTVLSAVTGDNVINIGDRISIGLRHKTFEQEWLLIKAKIVLL